LQTYIKLHAKIDVTADELDRTLEKFKYDIGYYSENINPENARCDNINVSEGTANIYYYDKGKNIKKLTVDINKISEFSDVTVKSAEDFFDILEEKFEKLGFKFDRKAMHNIGWLIDRYIPDARTAWAQEEKGSEEFEF